MTRAEINPGVCKMIATVEVTAIAKRKVRVDITSDCEKVARLSASTQELNLFEALKPHVDSVLYKHASESRLCASCPVPMAILKTIEIENGLALPRPVSINFTTTE